MGKLGGFMEYARQAPGYRPVEERLRDYAAVELRLSEPDAARQAARCMDCGTPFCHGVGCPQGNFIPEINDYVYRGLWREALELLSLCNPFPEITGRVCPAVCESACVLGIDDDPVSIRQIELAVIEAGFRMGLVKPDPPSERRKESVAVAGSGPAGLAAAYSLNRGGYNVTVFERAPRPGGILRYGIPDFKLEKQVLDRRLDLMRDEGVRIECGVEVGRDISRRYVSGRFSAMLLCCGAQAARDLAVPGREASGIHFALPYLAQQNMRNGGERIDGESIHAAGKRVLVIGGGDTGSDCVGTALRQGAVSVTQIEIMPEPPAQRPPSTPWPEWPMVRRDSSSHKEGGVRLWSVMTERFAVENGRVAAAHVCEVEWDNSGRGGAGQPRKRSGTEFVLPADLVLLAMGFSGAGANLLTGEHGLALDKRGFVIRDANCMTGADGIFAAGDMSMGASLVARAMADGRRAADGVMRWLEKQ